MKKLFYLVASCTMVTAAICESACNRGPAVVPVSGGADGLLIRQAQAYFDREVLPLYDPDSVVSIEEARMSLHNTPLWGKAVVQNLSIGKAVVVPVEILEPLFVKLDDGAIALSGSELTWLLLYQDNALRWHAEVVTKAPDDRYLQELPTAHTFE